MNNTSEQYFDCLCRTCMHELGEASSYGVKTKPEQQWQNIFSTVEECGALRIADLLSRTMPQIEVQLNDELPKKICCECLQQLLSVYRFQRMCAQSDQQMRKLITKRNAELKMTITESFVETNERRFEFEAVNSSPEAPQTSVADPLQSIGETIEHFKSPEDIVSGYIKTEACNDDEPNVEYSDGETVLSAVSVKNEIMAIGTEEEKVNFASSKHICPLCNKSFNKPRQLQNHLKRHKKISEQEERHTHSKKNIEHYRFKCDICNRYFHKPESLYKHRLVHDEKEANKLQSNACDICKKTYSSRLTLERHKRLRHTADTKLTQEGVRKRVKQQQHSAENTQKLQIQYSCEFCDKVYKSSAALRNHVRTHTAERVLCPECGKSFSTEGNLKNHLLRHSDIRPFECPFCPRRFPCSSDLTNHKLIHEGIKRHICDICGSAFSQAYQLRKHKKYHSGEKPYKCEYCEMSFVRMDHQRRHMRTHTGEKPYKCNYCERAFAQSNDHIKHLRTHIGDNVYRCKLCPLAFRLASELRSHFATHKHDDEETRERNMKALKEEEGKMAV